MTQSKHPPRWIKNHGAWYYRVPPGKEAEWDGKKWFWLGRTVGEAYRTWYERIGHDDEVYTMDDLFNAWWTGYVLPWLAESTHAAYRHHLVPLRKVFGHVRPKSIRASHAYAYRTKRPRVAGNREVSVLSSALTYGVQIGAIDNNPLRGQITRKGANAEPKRERVPTRDEIEAFCKSAPRLRGYITLKLVTGLRKGQLLSINLTEHWDRKTHTLTPPPSKGGRAVSYQGETLKYVLADILNGRLERGPLFLNQKANPMTVTGFNSAWRRAMNAFSGEPFHEHDIRKTVATDAETIELAQKLLGHRHRSTTESVYRIGPVKVDV